MYLERVIFLNSITRRRLELELCELQKDEEIVRKEVAMQAAPSVIFVMQPSRLKCLHFR